MVQIKTSTVVIMPVESEERRARSRLKISRPVLATPSNSRFVEDMQTTLDSSRDGIYFTTQAEHYYVGMRLSVTLGYSPTDPCNTPSFGEVVRVDRLKDGRFGIAIHIVLP